VPKIVTAPAEVWAAISAEISYFQPPLMLAC
jgi:hypothetical protein